MVWKTNRSEHIHLYSLSRKFSICKTEAKSTLQGMGKSKLEKKVWESPQIETSAKQMAAVSSWWFCGLFICVTKSHVAGRGSPQESSGPWNWSNQDLFRLDSRWTFFLFPSTSFCFFFFSRIFKTISGGHAFSSWPQTTTSGPSSYVHFTFSPLSASKLVITGSVWGQ